MLPYIYLYVGLLAHLIHPNHRTSGGGPGALGIIIYIYMSKKPWTRPRRRAPAGRVGREALGPGVLVLRGPDGHLWQSHGSCLGNIFNTQIPVFIGLICFNIDTVVSNSLFSFVFTQCRVCD